MKTVLVKGNTYPVRTQLYELGGTWDASAKGWKVPEDKEQDALQLVDNANPTLPKTTRRTPVGRRTGCSCGSREDKNGDLIPSPRNCAQCEHDA